MRFGQGLLLWIGTVSIAGCCTTHGTNSEPVDPPEVSARCSPVKDLLSKNYHRDGQVNLALVKAGGAYDRTGAILSGDEAARVAHIDAVCRAWVKGVIKDQEY